MTPVRRAASIAAAALAVVATGPLSACASSPSHSGGTDNAAPKHHPRTVLTIAYRPHGAEGPTRRWRLTCHPAGGSHPHPARACAELDRHPNELGPVHRACPFLIIRGAPDAHVRGHVGRRAVDRLVRPTCGPEWKDLPVLLTGR